MAVNVVKIRRKMNQSTKKLVTTSDKNIILLTKFFVAKFKERIEVEFFIDVFGKLILNTSFG